MRMSKYCCRRRVGLIMSLVEAVGMKISSRNEINSHAEAQHGLDGSNIHVYSWCTLRVSSSSIL